MKLFLNLFFSAKCACLITALFGSSCLLAIDKKIKKLTFSETQEWGEHEQWFLNNWKLSYTKTSDYEKAIESLPKPPALKTASLKRELAYLEGLQKLRKNQDIAAIEREKHLCGFWLGDYRFGLNEKVDELILKVYFDARLWGFKAKKHFNRVRPSFLENALQPSIENPPHPAYPSNHTFQALVVASLLADLHPTKAQFYIKDALQIGRNREVAGVHYPSDTEASVILANQFLRVVKKHPGFNEAFEKVKAKKFGMKWRKKDDRKDYAECLKSTMQWAVKNKVYKKAK